MLVRLCANSVIEVSDKTKGAEETISILEFPVSDGRQVGVCHHGEEILVLDGKPGGGGIVFLLIETANGVRGWISAHYIWSSDTDNAV